MKQVILLSLFLCFQKNLLAQQDTLYVFDAYADKHLVVEKKWRTSCKYLEGYIINKNYVIYQTCDSRRIFIPDIASFKVKGENILAIDKKGVYYEDKLVTSDTFGVKILSCRKEKFPKKIDTYNNEGYFWRTNHKVFFANKEIKVSDPVTFQQVRYHYYKDKQYLYYYDKKIKEADPNSIQGIYYYDLLSDKNTTYFRGKPLMYKGEKVQQLTTLILKTSKYVLRYCGNDKKTFEELPNYFDISTLKALSDCYLIDKNYIYYENPINTKDFRLPIPKENFNKVKVFNRYITDEEIVYRGNLPIQEYDPVTFGGFPNNQFYVYDKNGIYDGLRKYPIDCTKQPVYGENLFYINENKVILYENQLFFPFEDLLVKNLTQEQVQQVKEGNTVIINTLRNRRIKEEKLFYEDLYKANNTIYIGTTPQNVDTATFEKLTSIFYKDKNNVYYYDIWDDKEKLIIFKGYDDISTLKSIGNNLLADKNYLYFGRRKLIKNQNVEILAIYTGYRPSCSHDDPYTNYYLLKNSEGYWLAVLGGDAKIRFLGNKLNELFFRDLKDK